MKLDEGGGRPCDVLSLDDKKAAEKSKKVMKNPSLYKGGGEAENL